ncbi:hypothetical protein NPIL_39561 [Nephila pilipes]|uniref:Uncharacterized protein n=1 Tax=Nephila pilipes TaxID=299642 RepID=A0A8X6QXD1_NEPPI|nr:hypothetical protein NPIL_39561 [Nephila pilipes]
MDVEVTQCRKTAYMPRCPSLGPPMDGSLSDGQGQFLLSSHNTVRRWGFAQGHSVLNRFFVIGAADARPNILVGFSRQPVLPQITGCCLLGAPSLGEVAKEMISQHCSVWEMRTHPTSWKNAPCARSLRKDAPFTWRADAQPK